MRRFYSDDKNDRKRFTTQSVFSVTSIFTVKPGSSVFLPLGQFCRCVTAKMKVVKTKSKVIQSYFPNRRFSFGKRSSETLQ